MLVGVGGRSVGWGGTHSVLDSEVFVNSEP